MKKWFLIGCLVLLFHKNHAQISVKGPRIGIGYSGNTYFGDLNANEKLHRFYPGIYLSLGFETQKMFMPGFNVIIGKFIAQTRNLPPIEGIQPNSFVKTPFVNTFLSLKVRPLFKKSISPFLGFGLGLLHFTPKNEQNQNLSTLLSTRPPGESYPSNSLNFPMNLGVDFKLSRSISLGLNYFYVLTTTDYLDNIGKLGTQKGNDKMMQLSLSMQIVLEGEGRRGR
ncbi:MAG: hypothetical protein KatS3mg035_1209 [Bacteroidia bacterium]|nr:MAG: hypothetical protein KatS3mg035_1209 [Bacteroidia bacterium]